jgi:chromate transporter
MGAVTAGLIAATGLKLLPALQRNPLGMGLCGLLALLTFVAIALLRIPLLWVLLGLGGLSCTFAGTTLRRLDARAKPMAPRP